jgi:beta-N-acetylhexosaminidase
MRCWSIAFIFLFSYAALHSSAQVAEATRWADSVFNSLSDDQRIAQLVVVRSSGMDANGAPVVFDDRIDSLVSKYNIGAICAFQGSPLQHAAMFNRIQAVAKTPVMITVDAEWGLGMRFAGVKGFPYQLTMGAVPDAELVYRVGKAIGEQCRRMNIHVNYAPVADINNNSLNPVIGVRSFGEDKYKVALMAGRIMQGIQEQGVMACAKHFPGHGDVAVDSHFDLPVINKTMAQLDSLELYPFRQLFSKGVGSVMVAHLYIPAIDTIANQATSLSYKNITGLMRNQLGFNGLTFTDALEMKGVTKYYPGGEASVQSLIAGNDMLCLPESVPQTIQAVKKAVAEGRLTWEIVYNKCKRVLAEKYHYVLGKTGPVDTVNLVNDLNTDVPALRKAVAEKAITVLKMQDGFYISEKTNKKAGILYIAAGSSGKNELADRLRKSLHADVIGLPYSDTEAINSFNMAALRKYKKIIIGLHNVGRSPAKNFGVPTATINLINSIQAVNKNSILLTFGNPYVNKYFVASPNLVACYEDDVVFQDAAADWLLGKFNASGTLPVTVETFRYGTGIVKKNSLNQPLPGQ